MSALHFGGPAEAFSAVVRSQSFARARPERREAALRRLGRDE